MENSHDQSSDERSREKHKHKPFSSLLYVLSAQLYFFVLCAKKTTGKIAFKFKAPADWNNLPVDIRSISAFVVVARFVLPHAT